MTIFDKLNTGNDLDVQKIVDFIKTTSDEKLFHIDLLDLSENYAIEFTNLLNIFIHGVKNGVFIMEWEFHCTHCGGIANEALTLHSATQGNHCQLCNVHFINTLDENVEVFFSIHPNIRNISSDYKTKFKEEMVTSIVETNNFDWKRKGTIKGIQIIQNNVFRDLMGDEVLEPDQSLEIMHSTILFTDIKGSTEMYTKLGDAVAFKIVRDHFRILFDIIIKNNGIPVKTIGDAVMGVFINEQNGVTAALEIQKAINSYFTGKKDYEKIILKIGVHSGSTIIVTLNGRLDYFGNSVNTAARIQAQALPGEIVISENLFESNEIKKIIATYVKKVSKNNISLKGLNKEIALFHINISTNSRL